LTGGSLPQFSDDGRIAVGLGDQTMRPYLVDPAIEYRTFAHTFGQRVEYRNPAIRHDGRVLAVSTSRGVVLWDLETGVELGFLPVSETKRVIFEASGDLVTSSPDGVRRWPLVLDGQRGEFKVGPPCQLRVPAGCCPVALDRLGRIVAAPDHEFAFVATPERTIHVGPLDDCRAVAISPDGQWLVTGGHLRGVQVWRIRDGIKVSDLPVDYGTSVVFSPDERWLLTTGAPSRLWLVGTWSEVRQLGGRGLCFSPDGRMVAVMDVSRLIRLVETATGRTVARLESPDLCDAFAATFSPDGSRLVVVTNDGPAVHVWDLRAIRRHLVKLGLDWDWMASSYDEPADRSADRLPALKVDVGPLPLTESIDPRAYEPAIADLEAALAGKADQPLIRRSLARRCNHYAWILANAPESLRNPERALELARRCDQLVPNLGIYLNTLGVAQYRAGRCAEAVATLDRSLVVGHASDAAYNLIFLAMAHWQLGDKPRALACFARAGESMGKDPSDEEDLARFHDEAATLLKVNPTKD
jgi:WD40 repeat protein